MSNTTNNEPVKSATILEYSKIPLKRINGFLNVMLFADAICTTLILFAVFWRPIENQDIFTGILALAASTGIIIYFLVTRYLNNVSYRFTSIEKVELDLLAKIAEQFYAPLLWCMGSNIFLGAMGSLAYLLFVTNP